MFRLSGQEREDEAALMQAALASLNGVDLPEALSGFIESLRAPTAAASDPQPRSSIETGSSVEGNS